MMGICHFPAFRTAMQTTQAILAPGTTAVEMVDNNVLTLGADIAMFRHTLGRITNGRPDCLLLVESVGDTVDGLRDALRRLDACMADHGHPDAVVQVTDTAAPRDVWVMREACLEIMMSATGDAKPSASPRIAWCRRSIRRTILMPSQTCSPATARAAPDTPMLRSSACTCGRS